MSFGVLVLLLACVATDGTPAGDKDTSPDDSGADTGDTDDTTPIDLPAWVPDFTFAAEVPEAGEGGVLVVPIIQATSGGIVVLDEVGEVVWAYPENDDGLGMPPMRARLSLDGSAILFNHMAISVDTPGQIVGVPLDGSAPRQMDITSAHTDFVEYTRGGIAALGWEIRAYGDRKILGDTIVERAPDGTERVVWSVFDNFEPDLTQTYGSFYVPDRTVEDWSHINGISYSEAEDAYFVTMTFNNGIAKIDRVSGEMDWYMAGAEGGDFANPDREHLLTLPHSVQRIEGGVLAFSRGSPADPSACSEAIDLRLDETTREVDRAWSYQSPDCLLVTFLGGAERLPGGNTVITWTTAGQIDQVTPEGDVAWRVNTAIGNGLGFSSWAPRLGAP